MKCSFLFVLYAVERPVAELVNAEIAIMHMPDAQL